MIEAVVPTLFVVTVGAASYLGARLYAANPANHNAERNLARLKLQRSWLLERLQQARRENWDAGMVAQITDQLASTDAELRAHDRPPP